jgi:hypothetical protein
MELITYETIVTPYLDFVHVRGVMGIVDFSGAFLCRTWETMPRNALLNRGLEIWTSRIHHTTYSIAQGLDASDRKHPIARGPAKF